MKLGVLIATFNRPKYLRKCLESIKRAVMPEGTEILIVDDASTDEETKQLIHESGNLLMVKKKNGSIKESLLWGCDFLFDTMKCDEVMNLDGDGIISRNGITEILKLRSSYPDRIATGFHCTTTNRNGTKRHIIIREHDDCYERMSVGGINLCFDRFCYLKYLKPALEKSLQHGGNFDHMTSIECFNAGKPIISVKRSVVQHIGIEESAMNHLRGGEPPDVADTFSDKISLPDVTLIAVDDNVGRIIKAANISCRDIEFGQVKLLSCEKSDDPRVIPIRRLGSKAEYSKFMLKEITDYITTPYFITIQHDGYIVNGHQWNDQWKNFDYIGSPWWWYKDGMNVGNGAMSFRSKRLHEILQSDQSIIPANDELIKEYQEDHNICRIYRKYLEKQYNIKFAPLDVAFRFAIEAWGVPPDQRKYSGQFGFHGSNVNFKESGLSVEMF